MLLEKLICKFQDQTDIRIDEVVIPYPHIVVIYDSFSKMLPDMDIIRNADKTKMTIYNPNGRIIYEFYNMVLSSTQILENGDGTITVHYYLREIG